MRSHKSKVVAIMAAALLSVTAAAAAYGNSPPLTGTVVSLNHDLNYITVRDDVSGRNFKIDTRNMDGRRSIAVWNLRPGDRVRAIGTWENNETYRANRVMFAAANRAPNGLTGTVEDVNRDLHYITLRDQASGQIVKVDVRRMDTRRSVNVWQLHHGDLVTAQGRWAKNGNFRANFVNFDDATGRSVKIDVREMDTRRSVNVWRLRGGDHITVDGSWSSNGDRFQALMVRF